ncbi:hypothetical protein [Bradyrhizobium sp. Arg816]|uniref:hypothetical protein n=1 Tax=Bradyrhizobium sp. Arg816 TaxID=2998491 RepID=UPI00249F6CDF|nr:hypothetical protein [Bradyrhizobium sp. Arg816]MDI3566965.1 hypothetical protein [Bradyrhizobium sp. Arg816]
MPAFKEGRHRTSLIAASKSTAWVKQSLCLYSLFLPTFSSLPQRWEHDSAFTFCVLLAFAASLAAAAVILTPL